MNPKKKSFICLPGSFFSVVFIYLGIMLKTGYLMPGSTAFYETSYYHEILPYIQAFLRVLKGEDSLWYSFSVLWGSGTVGAYAAYAFSPFNLLYLIDAFSLPFTTCLICALKLGLSAVSFHFFAKYTLKANDRTAFFFSISYALGSCLLLFSTRPMWLDACYMLPLLVILIRQLLEHNKFFLMVPAFFYTILCCYSIAYPTLIFVLLLLIIMLVLQPLGKLSPKEHLLFAFSRFGKFLLSLCFAVLLGAFLLFPLFFVLRNHALASAAFPGSFTSIGDILSALFFRETPGFSAAVPYLYCGIPAIFLLPLFFLGKERSLPEKAGLAVLLALYTSAMLLSEVWHVFDLFADGAVAYRFAFCLTFLLCSVGCKTFTDVQNNKDVSDLLSPRTILLILIGSILFYGLMLPVREMSGLVSDNATLLSVNTFLLLLWCGLMLLYFRSEKKLAPLLPSVLLLIELFLNGCALFQSFPSAISLPLDVNAISSTGQLSAQVADSLKADTSLYRVRANNSARIGDGIALDIPALSSSAPYDNAVLRQNLHYLGLAQDNGRIYDYYSQELNDLLFGVKYNVDLLGGTIQPNAFFLPLAYAVSPSLEEYAPTYNPFANQAQIIEKMTGKQYAFFTPIDPDQIETESFNLEYINGTNTSYFIANNPVVLLSRYTFSFPRNGHQALLAEFYQDNASLFQESPFILSQQSSALYYSPHLSDSAVTGGSLTDYAGFYEDTDRFYLTIGSGEPPLSGSHNKSYISYFDDGNLEELANDLASGALTLTSRSEDAFSGTVTIPEDRTLLFISIPFDDGWDAYCDGERIAVYPILNQTFCALKLIPGEHTISMQYTAPGSITGGLVSMISVLILSLFACLSFLRRVRSSSEDPKTKSDEVSEKADTELPSENGGGEIDE